MKKRILFICSGNTCRSPMAEYLMKHALQLARMDKHFIVHSAGLFTCGRQAANALTIQVMKDISPQIEKHITKKITKKMLASALAIFCSTQQHKQYLVSNYQSIADKCFLLREFVDRRDIDDPFGGTLSDYQRTKEQISSAIHSIFKFLTHNENQHRE